MPVRGSSLQLAPEEAAVGPGRRRGGGVPHWAAGAAVSFDSPLVWRAVALLIQAPEGLRAGEGCRGDQEEGGGK